MDRDDRVDFEEFLELEKISKKFNVNMSHEQVGGDHYNVKIQPFTYIKANNLNYFEGDVLKYITRHSRKNGKEDLQKAKQYIEYMINNYEDLYK